LELSPVVGLDTNVSLAAKLQSAVALHQRGELTAASRLYEEILSVQPRHADALHLLGVIAAVSGDAQRAVDLIGRALQIEPRSAAALNNRGAARRELGHGAAAIDDFDQAIALKQDYAEAHYNRANVLKDMGNQQAALEGYERALGWRPEYPEAWSNRGVVLADLRRWEEAVASYQRAAQLRPGFAEAHYNCGIALCELRRWGQALASFDRAILFDSKNAGAHASRAVALDALQRQAEALASCDHALALEPKRAVAHCNRANLLLAMHRVPEALESYDRAVTLDPDSASVRFNRAMGRLLAGDYLGGWADYEWRWRDTTSWVIQQKRSYSEPRWLGEESLAGKTILVYSEQGYGDTLQFCRYVPLLAARGARVILEVPRPLFRLLESLNGVALLTVHGERSPPFDCHGPLMSLPFAFKTTLVDVPSGVPYLAPGKDQGRVWRERFGDKRTDDRPLRVGLAWSGGHRPEQPELWAVNERRNVPLAAFEAFGHPDIEFYSLQVGDRARGELAALTAARWRGPAVVDFTGQIEDFADTAALVAQLDLVISVDTSTVHLAGAMGTPVWILNRFDTCWRWMLDREDSPWYPTARIYRQRSPGAWPEVLDSVRGDLWHWADTRLP
jgi:tetratricopeptide (TPR) repeat protein